MKSILGKRILVVTAHPDDESYTAAGTILKNHAAGGTTYVACATFGEKGKSHVQRKVTAAELKRIRKKELLAVSKFLKISKLLMPGLPDAELGQKSHQDAFRKKLFPFAAKHRPDLIISFGAYGISGHIDHISVGKIAQAVAKELKIPFFTFAAPPELHKSLEQLKKRRKHGKYVQRLKRQPHDIEIRVNPAKKLKALRLHKSQHDQEGPMADFPEKTIRQVLTREYFSKG